MEEFNVSDALRAIPSVNEVLDCPEVIYLIERLGRNLVLDSVKLILSDHRTHISNNKQFAAEMQYNDRIFVLEYIVEKLKRKIIEQQESGLKRVINATGIILHTNLGRAPLPDKAVKKMCEVSGGYSNLEFDIESGSRGSRHSHIESLICNITGAESAMIVNNNAAAVYLCLNTIAANKQVVVSRGQQIEIGGGFRIPDIIAQSGAKMVEVGTTNKTRITDYLKAVTDETKAFLKVHTSNYKIVGFTEEVLLHDLVMLGKEKGIIVMEDLGSGCLFDLSKIGLPYEPTVQDSIRYGADIVTFSGDKLLGGPQAGIIAGRRDLISRIKENPISRMVRCDKNTIAAMTAVLYLYMDPDKVVDVIPAIKMMSCNVGDLLECAAELEKMIQSNIGCKIETEIIDDTDEVGGGSLPGVVLSGKAIALSVSGIDANQLQFRLRKSQIPVICRINRDRVLINVRTIDKNDYPTVVEALGKALELSI